MRSIPLLCCVLGPGPTGRTLSNDFPVLSHARQHGASHIRGRPARLHNRLHADIGEHWCWSDHNPIVFVFVFDAFLASDGQPTSMTTSRTALVLIKVLLPMRDMLDITGSRSAGPDPRFESRVFEGSSGGQACNSGGLSCDEVCSYHYDGRRLPCLDGGRKSRRDLVRMGTIWPSI